MTESYVQIENQESCETDRNRYNTMCDDDRKEILREENGEQYTGAADLRFTRIEMPTPPSRSNHIARSVIDNISGGAREVISNLSGSFGSPDNFYVYPHLLVYCYQCCEVMKLNDRKQGQQSLQIKRNIALADL